MCRYTYRGTPTVVLYCRVQQKQKMELFARRCTIEKKAFACAVATQGIAPLKKILKNSDVSVDRYIKHQEVAYRYIRAST